LSSSHQLVSPPASLSTSSQHLDDDVLREFDATRHLSELTTEWGVWRLVWLLLERNYR
jgi:hypothetical protein